MFTGGQFGAASVAASVQQETTNEIIDEASGADTIFEGKVLEVDDNTLDCWRNVSRSAKVISPNLLLSRKNRRSIKEHYDFFESLELSQKLIYINSMKLIQTKLT